MQIEDRTTNGRRYGFKPTEVYGTICSFRGNCSAVAHELTVKYQKELVDKVARDWVSVNGHNAVVAMTESLNGFLADFDKKMLNLVTEINNAATEVDRSLNGDDTKYIKYNWSLFNKSFNADASPECKVGAIDTFYIYQDELEKDKKICDRYYADVTEIFKDMERLINKIEIEDETYSIRQEFFNSLAAIEESLKQKVEAMKERLQTCIDNQAWDANRARQNAINAAQNAKNS